MPTDRSRQPEELTRQLHSGEAPRSPRELDERIVQYAREKAEQYAVHTDSAGFRWLGNGWKAALAVFSVAAVAISITIRIYDGSGTMPLPANRTALEAETVGTAEIASNELPAAEESQLALSAEPLQSTVQQDRNAQAQAAPAARATEIASGAGFQRQQQQDRALADAQNLQYVVNGPDLVELLASIGSSEATAPSDQTSQRDDFNNRLQLVLNALENAFVESSVNLEPVVTPGSPPVIEQLQAKASVLVATYTSLDNDQLLEQLESAYQRQRGANSELGLPLNLSITIEVLENWLSGR